ncbi:MAG: NTP pyrophosphohydrolase, Zn-finger domain protein [Candidatus Uhrbacteria bacterium GW2011_GWF2_41_16]|jgi:8-oxo-dGTP pyrophosphatase MutT (NUDIX family)|uniref:NTP pyrophosphohydrolase, Zn-finger domain protein n=2 Tax=Candidatus Uhriibacteriota TaxID=1752732 RepID=A0A0G0Y8S7_9BACT|nr:MAG: NTP pyrophosphohydrolase, Zn-finger domain protein [Candidatus Uhrbacteria bacterium GW2011_GWC2_41_11]KKR96697.1 MAG: NTP pyrophosphohydrolase, Zn-finger domain protein [Candidatus Uhrbacteria bacterium GW2011_GWF2_41_16]HBP00497.1 hypothetical protein [Candidatus Uhrbacteria bacterium]
MNQVVIGLITRKKTDGEMEYLLIQSKKDFGEFSGCWYPPGGHLEKGENEEDALVREIKEELHLHVRPLRKVAETPGDVENQNTHWWICDALSEEMNVDQIELSGAGWFTKQDLKSLRLWPATESFFNTYIFGEKERKT